MVFYRTQQFWATTALAGMTMLAAMPAYAGPQGGAVVQGQAAIDQTGAATTITQSSDRAIINWSSFNVDTHESVNFVQPSSTALTVNRINDTNPSQIDGAITANGRVMLLNANGIVFGEDARVDVAGLVASTGNVDDTAVMRGDTQLEITGATTGSIVNNGTITARDAGLVGLVAPAVENHGVINARLGRVALAGAGRVTLDLTGDNLITVDVTDTQLGRVANTGTITADGGVITLTARAAAAAVDTAIQNTGTLQANTIGTTNGRVVIAAIRPEKPALTAQIADIVQAGTIITRGNDTGETGGAVQVLAETITIDETSVIDASGHSGGGTINIGGAFQGGPDLPRAEWVHVADNSLTQSNGGENGDGGTIVFWADGVMYYRGRSEAEGGELEGDGGLVEVSGKRLLDYDGFVTTLAPNGQTGTLLLDPTNIEISTGTSSNVSGASPYQPSGNDVTSVLNATTLMTALGSASVTVQTIAGGTQLGNLTVNAALSWAANTTLTLTAANNIIVNQSITGRNVTLNAGNDVVLNADLIPGASGSGTLTFAPTAAATTFGIAGGTGTFNLDSTDFSHITGVWGALVFGNASATGAMNVNAASWASPVTLRTLSGLLTVAGTQTMASGKGLTITTNNLALNGDLSGNNNLIIQQANTSTSIGVGDTAAGTLNLTNAELTHIINGWSAITLGRSDSTGAYDLRAYTWNDNVTFANRTGTLTVNGAQNFQGNTGTFTTRNLTLNAGLFGTGTLVIQPEGNTSMAVATNGATFNVTNSMLDMIGDGFTTLAFGSTSSTSTLNVGARTWTDSVQLRNGSGTMTISGDQNVGSNNLQILGSGDVAVNAALTGTGTLFLRQNGDTVTAGLAGAAGTFNFSAADLDNITDGWTLIDIGRTTGDATITVGAYTWRDPVRFYTDNGTIIIDGDQNMGANNLTIRSDVDVTINAALTGTGTLTVAADTASTTMGIGGGAGTLSLTTTELGYLTDGWTEIVIGRTDGTGAITANAATWQDPLKLQSSTGTITISDTQTMGTNNLTFLTSALTLSGALEGSGTLTFMPSAVSTTIGLGGGAGTLNLTTTELGYLTDGWGNIIIGRTDGTGAITANAATWSDDLTLRSLTGAVTINGTQTMGANDLTLQTNALALAAGLQGTGILTIMPVTTSATIGLGGGAGTLNLTTTELGYLTDGWNDIVIGRTDGTGLMTINAATWNDDLTLRSLTGGVNIAGAQIFGGNDLTIETNSNLTIAAALTGSGGSATIRPTTASGTIGIGSSSASGTLSIDAAEATNFSSWDEIIIGRTDGTGAYQIGTSSWSDPVQFVTAGDLTLNGALTSTDAGSGTKFVLASTGSNLDATGGSINPGTGRYLVYTQSPLLDTYGMLTRPTKRYNRTYAGNAPATITETGNVYLYTIAPTLNVTISNATRTYGDANPAFTFASASGLIDGDTIATALDTSDITTAATTSSNAGTYGLTGTLSSSLGYQIGTVTDGTLTVSPRTVNIALDNQSRTYGNANPSLTYVVTGIATGDVEGDAIATAAPTTTATSATGIGTYAITGTFGATSNYQIGTITDGTLTISPRTVNVSIDNQSRAYGDANPTLTYTLSGLATGDTASDGISAATVTSAATGSSSVGTYNISGVFSAGANYQLGTVTDSTLTISPRTIDILINSASRLTSEADPTFTFGVSNRANGDSVATAVPTATLATAAMAGSPAGTYAITGSFSASSNYQIGVVSNGVLTILDPAPTTTENDNITQTVSQTTANPASQIIVLIPVGGESPAPRYTHTESSALTGPDAGMPIAEETPTPGTTPIVTIGGYQFQPDDPMIALSGASLPLIGDDGVNVGGAITLDGSVFTPTPTAKKRQAQRSRGF